MDAAWVVPAVLLLGTVGYILVRVLGGADLVELGGAPGPSLVEVGERHEALPWALIALAASALTLGLWLRDRRRAELADSNARARERAAAEADRLRRTLDQTRAELGARDRELDASREQLERAQRVAATQHEWAENLRAEVNRLHTERGPLGGTDDIRVLVLRIAIRLVGAEKGLLISDGEDRRVVACEGFDADPSESQLVKRFADDVIERDTIVREADPEPPAEGASPADAEIENLIAIPIYVRDEFHGVVVCANSDDVERHDDEVLVALGNQAGVILNNAALHGERHDAYVATVRMLAEAISIKDPHLGGHSHEVSAYVGRVADRLGLEPKRREELIFASLLHDVGKIGISERILLKPAGLTDEEYAAIKLHPRIGCRLVEQVPALSQLGPYILHHHEWFDGSGYPTGLKGEEIPLEARVIGIVDAFSAMTSDRPYRGRMSLEEACSELERCAGTQFDPEVVRIFVEEVRREPPSADAEDTALTALADPELAAVRSDDGPLVGTGPLDLVDHLTLLYTHRYFHEVAAAAAERANLDGVPFCITMFQLADIAEVNEDAGYGAGDALIKSAGRAVQEAAVRSGGTAARYSGRRIALLAECDSEANEALVASVRASLGDATRLAIGHAQWKPGDDGEDVIGRAEREMGALAGASEGAAPVPAEL